MKVNLTAFAITLFTLALAVSLVQPVQNFLMTFHVSEEKKPSFDMPVTQYHGNVIVGPITTSFFVVNNGSATAHDVNVRVYFDAHSYDIYLEQYVPEIEPDGSKTLYFPTGWKQLEFAWGNYGEAWGGHTNYTITIRIDCKEVPSAQQFEFTMH